MISIDKLKFWDLVRELSYKDICDLSDKIAQLKSLLAPTSDNIFEVDQTSDLTKEFLEQTNGDPKPARKIRVPSGKPFRMTDDEKADILDRVSRGETQTTIAEAIGRSALTIGKFIRSKKDIVV